MKALETYFLCAFGAVLLSAPPVAVAAEPPWRTQAYSDLCQSFNVHRAYTREQTDECFRDVFRIEDGRLNAAYDAALARLEFPRQKEALSRAQQAWVAFRDADCASYADADWGPSSNIEVERCRIWRTRQRFGELGAYNPAGVTP